MDRNSNGLCNVKCCLKKEKFTQYNGWRDPDVVNQPRVRSVPNRMKRFMAELRGELSCDIRGQANVERTRFSGVSSYTVKSGTRQYPDPPVLACVPGSKSSVDDCKPPVRLRTTQPPKGTVSVIRCETCDSPYESSRRRKPPHPYRPVIVFLPRNEIVKGDDDDKSLAGLKDLPTAKMNKVLRVKRRRSSTELYKGLVSVD